MKPLEEIKLRRVDTQEDVAEFLVWLAQPRDVLAFDTETGGVDGQALKWWLPGFQVRLVQFGDYDSAYVLRADRFGAAIEEVFSHYPGQFVSHNGVGFDGHALRVTGFSRPPKERWDDTLMMSKMLDSGGSNRLKDRAAEYFGETADIAEKYLSRAFELHGFAKNDKGRAFSEIPYGTPAYDVYSGVDVILTARLWRIYQDRVEQFRKPYAEEMGAWHVTAEHEARGLRVDLEYAREVQNEYELRIVQAEQDLALLGIHHPNRKSEKLKILYAEGWEAEDFTETGEPKLDKAALEKFASPTAQLLMEHNRLSGWKVKYIDKVVSEHYRGRIYPGYNPFGAKTGRQSASNPPLQQLPGKHEDAPKIRRMVLPEEGDDLWAIDFDGQEARLLAHYSQDPELLRIIREGLDIHTVTAARVFGVDESAVTKQQRDIAKTYRYASTYGAGSKKLAKGLEMTIDEVKAIGSAVDAAFSGVTAWKRKVEREGKIRWHSGEGAWAETWAGRRVYAEQFGDFEPKFYTLSNFILQGSGADMLKVVLNRLAAAELSQYLLLPVHDELILSLPQGSQGAELAQEISKLMAFTDGEFSIPMTCAPAGPFRAWSPH